MTTLRVQNAAITLTSTAKAAGFASGVTLAALQTQLDTHLNEAAILIKQILLIHPNAGGDVIAEIDARAAAIDAQAFVLAGQPPETVTKILNLFCENLDRELIAEIPDIGARASTVIETASAICRRLDEFSSHGCGHA
jgi:hypothetical protein